MIKRPRRTISPLHEPEIGEIVLCDFPRDDNTHGVSPVMIWQIFYNHAQDPIHYSVMKLSPASDKKRDDQILLSPNNTTLYACEESHAHSILKCHDLVTVPSERIDLERPQQRVVLSSIMPDIIIRRVHGLIANKEAQYRCLSDFNDVARIEGYSLSSLHLKKIRSQTTPSDVIYSLQVNAIDTFLPLNTTIDDADFSMVQRWAIATSWASKNENGYASRFPPLGTWPHWPDMVGANGIAQPCASPATTNPPAATLHP